MGCNPIRYSIFIILILTNVSTSCMTKEKSVDDNEVVHDTIVYPNRAYVCFDPAGKGKREHSFKIGDSLQTVRRIFRLTQDTLIADTVLKSKEPLVVECKFGLCIVSWMATFDGNERLKNFQSTWKYKGDTTQKGRSDFYGAILSTSMTCLWEQGPNIYLQNDTFKVNSFDGSVVEFRTDMRDSIWTVTFESRLM